MKFYFALLRTNDIADAFLFLHDTSLCICGCAVKMLFSPSLKAIPFFDSITSKVDYCNGLLTGLPKKTLKKLQLVQYAAARVLTKNNKFERIHQFLNFYIGFL